MRVFVDTNIYLGFIELSQEKLDSLSELRKLVVQGKLSLVFPKITQDELFRRIPLVSLRQTNDLSQKEPAKPQLAVSVRNGKEKKKIKRLYEEYQKAIKAIQENYLKSVDKLTRNEIEPLIRHAASIHENDKLVDAARKRRLKGNPPGKRQGPIGDEIEWEILINLCSDDELIIITNDGDWKHPDKLKNELHPFLIREWKAKTKKKIKLYSTLGEFINKHTKKKIAKDTIEKERKTTERVNSYISQADTGVVTFVSTASASIPTHTTAIADNGTISFRHFPSTTTSAAFGAVSELFSCVRCGRMVTQEEGAFVDGKFVCNECLKVF